MKIKDVMVQDVRTCGPNDTLEQAARHMWEADCGCTPVVEDGSRVVGMLTDRDMCMAAYTRGVGLGSIRARDVMSTELRSCRPDDDVSVAERMMREFKVRRIPVVNGGHLVGMVTLNDLAIAANDKSRGIRLDEVGKTLATICEHREGARRARAA